MDLKNLPENCDEATIKEIANVKHIISTEIQYDNFLGTCKGDGRVKIRLNDGETYQDIKDRFSKAGYFVKTHTEDPRKKPAFTGPAKDDGAHKFMNAKDKKTFEMQTKAPIL